MKNKIFLNQNKTNLIIQLFVTYIYFCVSNFYNKKKCYNLFYNFHIFIF